MKISVQLIFLITWITCLDCVPLSELHADLIWEETSISIPNFYHIKQGWETREEAYNACADFAVSHGYIEGFCHHASYELLWSAGWLRWPSDGMTFYLGSFWYEKDLFYLSAPVYSCTTEGNPCVPATGEKIQTETDIQLAGGVIRFKREYRSQNITGNRGGLGVNWSHGFAKRMDYFPRREELAINTQIVTSRPYNTREEACAHGWEEIRSKAFRGLASNTKATGYRKGVCEIMQGNKLAANLEVHSTLKAAYRPDAVAPPIHVIEHGNGRRYVFQESGGNWFETNSLPVQLKRVGSDWVFTDAGGNTEYYGTDGLIIRLTDMRGKSLFFTYDDNNRLSVISDQFGHRLEFSYDALGNLVSVMGPEGLVEYDYDVNNNLTTVTYPGGSSKTYLYEDPDFPHHLTGITNEKSERFATWKYDDQGRVVISEHAGGADHVAFTYNADHTTTVSDNLGAQRTYHFLLIKGQMKVAEVTGDRCVSCAGGDIQQRIFDSNGFLASTTDWNGNTTTYVRDEWGKELSRTEAAGTPDARIITTDWHADLPLPIRITGPARITEFNYDTAGRLVSKRVRTAEEQIKEE